MRLLHISSCWLENAQKSLTASGQQFFQQPSTAVDFGATMESFIFTVQLAMVEISSIHVQ